MNIILCCLKFRGPVIVSALSLYMFLETWFCFIHAGTVNMHHFSRQAKQLLICKYCKKNLSPLTYMLKSVYKLKIFVVLELHFLAGMDLLIAMCM